MESIQARNASYIRTVRWAEAFRALGDNLAGVFVPVILLSTGFTIQQVLFYMFTYSVLMVLNSLSTYWVNTYLGTRYGLFLGYIFQGLFYVALVMANASMLSILLLSFCSAMIDGFLWSTRHYVVSRRTLDESHSRQLAFFAFVGNLVSLVGLVLAIVISKNLNDSVLIWAAAALAFISAGLVLRLENEKVREKLSIDKIKSSISYKEGLSDFGLSALGFGFISLFGLYVATQLKDIPSVAAISIFIAIVGMVVSKLNGMAGDRGKNRKLIIISTIFCALFGPVLFFAQTVPSILVVSTVISVLFSFMMVPWVSIYYAKVKKSDLPYHTVMGLEIWGDSGRAFMAVLAWGLSMIVSINIAFVVTFSLSGLLAILMNFMDDHLFVK